MNSTCFIDNGANHSSSTNCTAYAPIFYDFDGFIFESSKSGILSTGKDFFAYFTPVILLIGILGNILSLAVFTRKNMWKLSASTYLAALSMSDMCSLVFYVLIEWMRRGLVHIHPDAKLAFLDVTGICEVTLYLSYVSRCMSSWIVVAFTVERFNGVCYPLKMMKRSSTKILLCMLACTSVFVLYKPILSGEYTIRGRTSCTANPDRSLVSFILDSSFAFIISLVPFLIITTLNVFIVRKLLLRNIRENEIVTKDTQIRLEFTIILFAISFFFVSFNLPYFIVWCRNFLNSHYIARSTVTDSMMELDVDYWHGILFLTRTIFYMNYCVNFFLYSITGSSFRRELAILLRMRKRKRRVFKSGRHSFTSTRHSSVYSQQTVSLYATDVV